SRAPSFDSARSPPQPSMVANAPAEARRNPRRLGAGPLMIDRRSSSFLHPYPLLFPPEPDAWRRHRTCAYLRRPDPMSLTPHATFIDPAAAAKVLRGAIAHPEKPLTVADAAAQSGLALRDADRGLHALVKEYRGHLRATDKGELLFVFPT